MMRIAWLALAAGIAAGADLKSAEALAFGPDGILFIGDSVGAAIFALDTQDRVPAATNASFEVTGVADKIAALLGSAPGQILIYDSAVNPISKNVYLAVSRGRGPDAAAVIVKLDRAGKLSEVSLDSIKFGSVALPNAAHGRRMEAITSIQFIDGHVIVAGLSNEEFSSNLRSIPFPFPARADAGAGIEIYHTSHGAYETNAPVRTFVPLTIGKEQYILAAYTCTPLVTIPVSALTPGNQVTGSTIEELGPGNRPLDMIAYHKDGHDYVVIANSARGVIRLTLDHPENFGDLTSRPQGKIIPRMRLPEWKRVHQLKKVDDATALIMTDADGSIDLRTVALP
jgi:hypothetical protein